MAARQLNEQTLLNLNLELLIMSIEIQIVAAIGGLLLLLTLIQGTRNVLFLGLATAAGNQHDIAPWTGTNDRLNRAIRNLIEARHFLLRLYQSPESWRW